MEPNNLNLFYKLHSTNFGAFTVIWSFFNSVPKINRIFLLWPDIAAEKNIKEHFVSFTPLSCSEIDNVVNQLEMFIQGTAINFSLDLVRMDLCSEFQQKVLRTEHKIPYGCVSTYLRIAKHLQKPTASRAVGNALANNPFPIIIPCHRAIRTDFTIGGFQGGIRMKRSLLEFEGNKLDGKMRVINPKLYY